MSVSSLKMPEAVVLDEANYTNSFGRFTSLQGAAITSVKFSGVLHEFTTIEGIVEDVSEIILNLKQVRMKFLSKKPNKIDLTLSGAGVWVAGDIQKASNEIEILNPDLHIATLNKSAKLDIEIRVGKGVGYVPAAENITPEQTIGVIPIDSIFTPIKLAKYEVENVRIGDKNDFEKLIFEITTDGSITPDDALTQAAKVLRDHVQLFINFDIEQEEEQNVSQKDSESERIKKILLTPVDDLELSVRSHNCLKAANIKNLAELVRKDEQEMLKFRNFGRKSLAELMEIVETLGLDFGMDVDKFIKEDSESN